MGRSILEKILSFFHFGSNDKMNTVSASPTGINREKIVPVSDLPPQPSAEGYTKCGYIEWDPPSIPGYSQRILPEDTNVPTDTPPAYADALNANTPEAIIIDHPDESVQICPHETLSFARLQRLINLPRFRYNQAKIDALTPDFDHHHRGHDQKTKECQDSCKPLGIVEDSGFVGSLKGFGTYSYQSPYAGCAGGLALSFHWEMKCLDPEQVTYQTTTELQEFFKTTGISLCPHTMLSDIDIVNMIHPIINRNGKPADPIDRYLAKEAIKYCATCPTEIRIRLRTEGKQGRTCRIDTKRWFGGGDGRHEQWRSQCVESFYSGK